MKQKPESSSKSKKRLSAEAVAARAARAEKLQRIQVRIGYAIVELAVLGGFVLSFWPQVFGVQQSNPAIGVGLTVLALFRLYVLRREVRNQAMAESASPQS